jgi:hypothetical protein
MHRLDQAVALPSKGAAYAACARVAQGLRCAFADRAGATFARH